MQDFYSSVLSESVGRGQVNCSDFINVGCFQVLPKDNIMLNAQGGVLSQKLKNDPLALYNSAQNSDSELNWYQLTL